MGFVRFAAISLVALGCGDNIHFGGGDVLVAPRSELATTEAGDTAVFTVALTNPPLDKTTVDITSMDLREGTVSPRAITFHDYDYDEPHTVTIAGVDDQRADGNAPYLVHVDAGLRIGAVDVELTNLDDEVAGFAISPSGALMTSEAGQQVTFTLALTSQPSADVTIPIATTDASEGVTDLTALVFTADTWNTPQTIVVSGVQDIIADGSVAYSVTLGPAESDDSGYTGLDPDDLPLINVDDELRGIVVAPLSMETDESGTQATFSVVLQTQPTAAVTIAVASNEPDEATASAAQVVFTPTDWNTPQLVTVTGVDDLLVDGDQPFTIALAAAVSGDSAYNGFDPDDVTGVNHDNDQVGVSVTPTSITTTEAGGNATFEWCCWHRRPPR